MGSLETLTGATVFQTQRLLCRRWRASDLDALWEVYSDPEAARWVGDGEPITRDECDSWLQVTANNYSKRGYGMFALDDRATNQTIGFCGLVHPGNQVDAEIKYSFLQSHWGQGLASEVIPATLAYGVAEHRLTKIIATVHPMNLASQRVLLKSGLEFTGEWEDEDGDSTRYYEWHYQQE